MSPRSVTSKVPPVVRREGVDDLVDRRRRERRVPLGLRAHEGDEREAEAGGVDARDAEDEGRLAHHPPQREDEEAEAEIQKYLS